MQEGKIFVRVKINKEKQNTVEQKKKVDRWIRYFISDKRTRSTGSSLSYPAAQNIAQQDLYGGHYDEEVFTTPKSRIPLERLHKTTIKTEMNEDSKKKKKKENFSHNDYLIVWRVLLTQKLIHGYFLIL